MLLYSELEHFDKFGKERVYWVDVTGVPKRFMDEAREIDGGCYSDDGFGVCIHHDTETGEYVAVEDEPGHNLYYVDNLGEKNWFNYTLSERELEQITGKICEDREKEEKTVTDLSPYYVSAMQDDVQEEIRQKVIVALKEAGQCTPENVEKAMCSKIYDLEDLIDIREYVKQLGRSESSQKTETAKSR